MKRPGGSMDITVMSQLYCEPVGENELKRRLTISNWEKIMAVLAHLIQRALVEDIHKDSNGPVYKLTRKGMRILEKDIEKRMCS